MSGTVECARNAMLLSTVAGMVTMNGIGAIGQRSSSLSCFCAVCFVVLQGGLEKSSAAHVNSKWIASTTAVCESEAVDRWWAPPATDVCEMVGGLPFSYGIII